jgi:hypothetical protein
MLFSNVSGTSITATRCYTRYEVREWTNRKGKVRHYKKPAGRRIQGHLFKYWRTRCQVCGDWFVIRTLADQGHERISIAGMRRREQHANKHAWNVKQAQPNRKPRKPESAQSVSSWQSTGGACMP